MTKRRPGLAGLLALCALASMPGLHAKGREIVTEEDRTLYALGLSIAESVSRFQLTESELELVARGLEDGVLGRQAGIQPGRYREKIDELATVRLDRAFRERERHPERSRSPCEQGRGQCRARRIRSESPTRGA